MGEVELVVVRFDDEISVFHGRCLHRGALMPDGQVPGKDLICGVHTWDDRLDTGVSAYAHDEKPPKSTSSADGDDVCVDADETNACAPDNPQPFNRDAHLGLHADTSPGTEEEPHSGPIQQSDRDGRTKTGHHGAVTSMGVPRTEMAGTGICSGEGGMLPEERAANGRHFYEPASARFGVCCDKPNDVRAFHFKGGQGAQTVTGGHLPGNKVQGKRADVRGLEQGPAAISPPRFPDWTEVSQIREFADDVRGRTGGIPTGGRLSAQHIEKDIDAAHAVGVDCIILDARGGRTGAAPVDFRDNISVPTIPVLARARAHLDKLGRADVTLVITGGLRKPAVVIKAMALGAKAIAVLNSAMRAIGSLAMRACHNNNFPVGLATQKPHLVSRIVVDKSARKLANFLGASAELAQVKARACGHDHVSKCNREDLTTWKEDLAELSGVAFGGPS